MLSEITDPEAFTPAYLIYARRILSVSHTLDDLGELVDPIATYILSDQDMKKQIDTHSQLIQRFQKCRGWEYLSALRKFYRFTGHNKQVIRKGDIVVVHDHIPRLHWKFAVVEEPIKGNNCLVHVPCIKTNNCITTRLIMKLYPLEVVSNDQSPIYYSE